MADSGGSMRTQPSPTPVLTTPAITVTELTRSYPSGARVGPLTFEVPRGTITGLVGPNGVGKTTTIRMLLGLITPTSGHLSVLDADSRSPGAANLPQVLPRVGALVDGPALVPTLSGRHNLLMINRLAGWPDSNVDSVLAMSGLTDRADRPVREYSLGMRQRLALAGALLGDPELLIVDEPANGLDPQGIAELRVLLTRISERGTTIVVSSHVLAEVEQVCSHLVMMSESGVVFHGSRNRLAQRLRGSLLVDTGSADDRHRLQKLLQDNNYDVTVDPGGPLTVRSPGKQSIAPEGARVNELAIGASVVLSRIEPRTESLEDIFFALTGLPGSTGDRLGVLDGSAGRRVDREPAHGRRWRPTRFLRRTR